MKHLAHFFLIIGALAYLLGIYQIWLRVNPNRLAFTEYHSSQQQTSVQEPSSEIFPKRLVISNRHINVTLLPAKVTNNVWETTPNGASYLLTSPIPGESGNSVIYAHNWAGLFANLPTVKPGDVVEVMYSDGSRKQFIIEYTSFVDQNESTILSASEDKRITLYTCAGWFDEKRFVAVAVLKG